MPAAVHPQTLDEVSKFLGFAPQHIFYLVRASEHLYFEFSIPKSNGKRRRIAAPRSELKGVQKTILSKILEPLDVSEHCWSYVPGRNMVEASRRLAGGKAALSVDLKDFFPSISARRVFGYFRSLGYSSKAAFIFTRLTTYKSALCQGAPTSPYLSNLIFREADDRLMNLAASWSLSYVRYSDDLYFVGNRDFRYKRLLPIVSKIISDSGFTQNNRKTKYFRQNAPRFTLGLQTGGKSPEFSRSQKRLYRSAFFNASHSLKWGRDNSERLQGMAEWHRCVYGADDTYREYQNIIRNLQNLKLHDVFVAG